MIFKIRKKRLDQQSRQGDMNRLTSSPPYGQRADKQIITPVSQGEQYPEQ